MQLNVFSRTISKSPSLFPFSPPVLVLFALHPQPLQATVYGALRITGNRRFQCISVRGPGRGGGKAYQIDNKVTGGRYTSQYVPVHRLL
ncbi:hypothetical protein BGX38DRAFT_108833 [Terfezia claveryi]|nr:hypothetical protein BGX38DRAFT_108833 [Terfezia claveryi]